MIAKPTGVVFEVLPVAAMKSFILGVIPSRSVCEYRRGLDWWMDLLSTYTHASELQALNNGIAGLHTL
jgi:hypothetical protein